MSYLERNSVGPVRHSASRRVMGEERLPRSEARVGGPEDSSPPPGLRSGAGYGSGAADPGVELPEPDDTPRLLREYARTHNLALRNVLVTRHEWLVARVVRSFSGTSSQGGSTREDLVQVGRVALIRAVERFEPERGTSFAAFAFPTVAGVIKHYLRDQTWGGKAPRRLRELGQRAARLGERLEQTLGRPPTPAEVAAAAGVDEDLLIQAMDVLYCYSPSSLDAALECRDTDGMTTLTDGLGRPDPALAAVEHREVVRAMLRRLDERQQRIIVARFFQDQSQAEVATQLGISQMHVSRLERQALRLLRACIGDLR